MVLQFFELEFGGEHIVHQVVKVGAINETLSLVPRVHGHPAEVAGVSRFTLHEGPQRLALDRDGLLSWKNENLTHCIQ